MEKDEQRHPGQDGVHPAQHEVAGRGHRDGEEAGDPQAQAGPVQQGAQGDERHGGQRHAHRESCQGGVLAEPRRVEASRLRRQPLLRQAAQERGDEEGEQAAREDQEARLRAALLQQDTRDAGSQQATNGKRTEIEGLRVGRVLRRGLHDLGGVGVEHDVGHGQREACQDQEGERGLRRHIPLTQGDPPGDAKETRQRDV
mmetsp:Transcript_66038/g.206924  ORF Transcript_66038/g.206924 Transcript_66038/m.206924 type:complete len:200 (-) Transcript_66038:379-978(-)